MLVTGARGKSPSKDYKVRRDGEKRIGGERGESGISVTRLNTGNCAT